MASAAIYIYSNDGSTLLKFISEGLGTELFVTSTGIPASTDSYIYEGDKTFLGFALNANSTVADYPIGSSFIHRGESLYIVEATTVTYNGAIVANLEAGRTATLSCSGKKAKSDIAVAFGAAGTITYNGTETAVSAGQTATMACNGKKMKSDVVVSL